MRNTHTTRRDARTHVQTVTDEYGNVYGIARHDDNTRDARVTGYTFQTRDDDTRYMLHIPDNDDMTDAEYARHVAYLLSFRYNLRCAIVDTFRAIVARIF